MGHPAVVHPVRAAGTLKLTPKARLDTGSAMSLHVALLMCFRLPLTYTQHRPALPCRCQLYAICWVLGISCTLGDFTNLPYHCPITHPAPPNQLVGLGYASCRTNQAALRCGLHPVAQPTPAKTQAARTPPEAAWRFATDSRYTIARGCALDVALLPATADTPALEAAA